MSLVSWYRLDEADATLGTDSIGSRDMTNVGVTSVTDTYGDAAYFDGSSHFNLASASVHSSIVGGSDRVFSCWLKAASSGAIHGNGDDANHQRYRAIYNGAGRIVLDFDTSTNPGTISTSTDTWFHYVSTYEASTSLSKIYINGVEDVSVTRSSLNTATGAFSIGRDPTNSSISKYSGIMSDFRIYSGVLDATEINALYALGPLDGFVASISATMYTHLSDLTWTSVLNASLYTVSQTKDSGTEEIIVSGTTDLFFEATGLNPGSSYEYKLYTDLDLVTPTATVTETTPSVTTSEVGFLLTRLGNDLTQLSDVAFQEVDPELRNALFTGDVVKLNTGDFVFVEDSDTLQHTMGSDILTPFDATAGSGQSCTVTIQEGDSTVLTYDESTNEVISESTQYAVGDHFVLGSYKVRIVEI